MLDDDARRALAAYELVGRVLNEQLRAGVVPAAAHALDRAFSLVPSTRYNTIAWRGSRERLDPDRQLPFARRELGYMSLTTAESVARFFAGESGTVFRTTIPVGVPIIVIADHIDPEYPLERELLLPRGLVVTVDRIYQTPGSWRADARIGG